MFIKLLTNNTNGEIINTDNICSMFLQATVIKILFTGRDSYEHYTFKNETEAKKIFKMLEEAIKTFKY